MMKLLPFIFGAVTLECADAKMWNDDGDNVRKACCFLIDLVADGLKFTLRATESDYGKKMKFKRRILLNEQQNHSRRRDSENNKTNERLSRCQENMKTRSRGYIRGLEKKYLNHRRDYKRYREMIANDVTLKTCLQLAPFLQKQYQQKRDMYSVRLKKEHDHQMTDHAFNHRDDVPYSKPKFLVGYAEEDCEPNDSNLSINYYESSNDRFNQNVPEISTYRGEIVGDNQFFTDKNKRSMEDFKGDTIHKRKIIGIRQMHGDTIPEKSYNESSYTSLEAEADDENSQCGNEIEKGMKFSKRRNVEDTMTMNPSGNSLSRAVKWIFGGCPGTCRHISKSEKEEEEERGEEGKKMVEKEEIGEKLNDFVNEWLCLEQETRS
ncbi:hypothetical protein M0802_005297 [Mischocyttarus mexicanus]|nr:hypothetical protein M0802_005297 [Mischocyttarus mexicanus]